MIPIKDANIVYSNLRGEAHEFNASGDRYIIVRVYEDDDAFDDLSKVRRVKTVQNAKLRCISVKVRIPREDSTNKEKEILMNEFENLICNLVSLYLKLDKFESYEISFDTHQKIKEIYDIKITKRRYEEADNEQ